MKHTLWPLPSEAIFKLITMADSDMSLLVNKISSNCWRFPGEALTDPKLKQNKCNNIIQKKFPRTQKHAMAITLLVMILK